MPSEFKPGDRVEVTHVDALNHSLHLEGVVWKPSRDPRFVWVDIGSIRIMVDKETVRHGKVKGEGVSEGQGSEG